MNDTRLKQLKALLKEDPGSSFIQFAIAKEYEKYEQWAQACTAYETLTTNDPDYVGTYYHLGKLYEKLNRPADAFQTYKTGMEAAKRAGDQHALSELAGAKLTLGDEEDFQ
ncbi:MAG: tetratricopeptide repeat protein [Phaeodactylibacter sp.]|uniref:tetratricopeptide repeat protein n=1 Tax=Phaeodactylibacter sp. TaxID=1940289 RepID=UPI0032ED4ADD